MLVIVLNMPEHSSFQHMLFPMLFISKYAKSYASIMDISLHVTLDVHTATKKILGHQILLYCKLHVPTFKWII